MGNINSVNLSGRLTGDATLRQTAGGSAVCGFSLAVSERRKNNATGEWEDYANFVECSVFGERSEKLAPYLTKGRQATVHGRLHWSSWEKDGQRRSKLEVIVGDLDLGALPRGQEPQQQATAAQTAPKPQQAPSVQIYDEEIPF